MELGKFEILEELGRGGFGTVYKARDKALNRLVAIKVLHPNLVNDPAFLGRFRQEAQIAANLDHPNLVPVYDYGEDEGRYYIVMGYMPGGSLKELLKNKGLLSKERALEILQQIGAGLVYAHKRSVIHRDLKPGNILFDDEGKARVSDMGFAKILQSDSSMSMSTSGGLIGTPAYMAPEIWNGQPATAATDIYNFACILVEMLTGKPLFEGDTTPMVMKKHFEPLNLPDLLPKEWKPAVEIALEKEPGSRFAGVEQFVRKLKRADEIVFDNTSHEQDNYLNTHDLQEEVQNPDQPSPEVGKEHFHSPDPVSKGPQKSSSGFEGEKRGVPQNKTPLYLGLGMLVLLAVFLIIRSGEFSAHPQSTVEPEIVQVQETATKQPNPTQIPTKGSTSQLQKTPTSSPKPTSTTAPSPTSALPTATNSIQESDVFSSPKFQLDLASNISEIVITSDGATVVVLTEGKIRQFDASTWEELPALSIGDVEVTCIDSSSKDNKLVYGDETGALGIWTSGVNRVYRFNAHPAYVREVYFSHDGSMIYSRTASVKQWNSLGGYIASLQECSQRLDRIFLPSIGYSLIVQDCGAYDTPENAMRFWTIGARPLSEDWYTEFFRYKEFIATSPDGTLFAANDSKHGVQLWKLKDEGYSIIPTTQSINETVAFSHNNSYFAIIDGKRTITIVSLEGNIEKSLSSPSSIDRLILSPNDNEIISWNTSGRILVWDIP